MKRPKSLKEYEPIEIIFLDPSSDYGWKFNNENTLVNGSALCSAVGYYLTENKTDIIISMIINKYSFADTLAVPLGCVQSIRRLNK